MKHIADCEEKARELTDEIMTLGDLESIKQNLFELIHEGLREAFSAGFAKQRFIETGLPPFTASDARKITNAAIKKQSDMARFKVVPEEKDPLNPIKKGDV